MWIFGFFLCLIIFYTDTINTHFAFAQNFNIPEGKAVTLSEIGVLVTRVASFMVYASGIIMVVFLIWGGITWMYGGADPKKVEEARKRVWQAFLGAVIILGIGVILRTAQALVTRDFFSATPDGTSDTSDTSNRTPNTAECDQLNERCCQTRSSSFCATENLVCTENVCKLAGGAVCREHTDCASGTCQDMTAPNPDICCC